MAKQRSPLASVGIFEGIDERDLQRLERAASARERVVEAGQTLVEEGRHGVGLFVLLSGRAKVVQRTPDGQERELRTLGPGDYFGEMALFGDWVTRSATVTALERTEAVVLARHAFLEFLRRNPDIAIRMLETLSRRVVEAEQRAAP